MVQDMTRLLLTISRKFHTGCQLVPVEATGNCRLENDGSTLEHGVL